MQDPTDSDSNAIKSVVKTMKKQLKSLSWETYNMINWNDLIFYVIISNNFTHGCMCFFLKNM
jgi:hypothetical protein